MVILHCEYLFSDLIILLNLQAVVMSFVPENVVQNLPSNRGTDLKSHKLKAIADWFKENLRLEDRKSDIIDLENDTQVRKFKKGHKIAWLRESFLQSILRLSQDTTLLHIKISYQPKYSLIISQCFCESY